MTGLGGTNCHLWQPLTLCLQGRSGLGLGVGLGQDRDVGLVIAIGLAKLTTTATKSHGLGLVLGSPSSLLTASSVQNACENRVKAAVRVRTRVSVSVTVPSHRSLSLRPESGLSLIGLESG